MKFTKEQLLGKKIRYNGEKQWQQIVDACTAVGIPVASWCGCEHKDGNTVANISHNFGTDASCVLLSSKWWDDDGEDTMEEFSNLDELVFPFQEEEKNQVASWDVSGYPPVGAECEYSLPNSDMKYRGTFTGAVNGLVYIETPQLQVVCKFKPEMVTFHPVVKSWQEVLCDDLAKEDYIDYIIYNPDTDLFNIDIGDLVRSNDLVSFAERIIELSSKPTKK